MQDELKRRQLIKEKIEKYRVVQKGKIDYKKLIKNGRRY